MDMAPLVSNASTCSSPTSTCSCLIYRFYLGMLAGDSGVGGVDDDDDDDDEQKWYLGWVYIWL